jgi:signal transduction histidine kinase
MAALLRSVETYRFFIERQGNTLTFDIPDSLPKVNGDGDMLLQVMVNLLSNANRHTHNGRIAVIASEQEKGDTVSVTVQDDGEGVLPELMPDLFTRGVSEGGTGFGLSICKGVIEAHGGDISLKSAQGKGTSVTFILPVCKKPRAEGEE